MAFDETKDEHLKKLLAQRKAIDARIRKRQNQKKRTAKQLETQRLILVGRAMEAWARHSNENAQILRREIEAFVTRNDQRALFNLPLLREPEKT